MNTKYTVERFDVKAELVKVATHLGGGREVAGYVWGELKSKVLRDLETMDDKKMIAEFPKRLFHSNDFTTALEHMVAASADVPLPFAGVYMLLNDYGVVPKNAQPPSGNGHTRVGLTAYALGGAPPGYIIRLLIRVTSQGYAMGRLKSWRKKQTGGRR